MDNLSSKTQKFFSETVNGANDKFVPKVDFVFGKHTVQDVRSEYLNKVFESFAGNFDKHIACSIPLFREAQVNKLFLMDSLLPVNGVDSARVLDIGGSEATLLKTLYAYATRPDCLQLDNLEPNPDMAKVSEDFPHINVIPEAFLEGFDDVKKFEADSGTYDIINETMTFQFIKKDRSEFVAEVARLLKEDGVFFTEEKFSNPDKSIFKHYESIKDSRHKAHYFTEESIDSKKEVVLTGMSELQCELHVYEDILKHHFTYVDMYYEAGNFAGFVCTNSRRKISSLRDKYDLGLRYNVFNSLAGYRYK